MDTRRKVAYPWLWLFFFQYRVQRTDAGRLITHQVFSARSTDQGRHFNPPRKLSPGPMQVPGASIDDSGTWKDARNQAIEVLACSSPALNLGGKLVLPVYGGAPLNLKDLENAPRSRVQLLWSRGGEEAFTAQTILPKVWSDIWLQEPALLDLGDGKLLLHVRTASGQSPSSPGKLSQSRSEDGGRNWTPWRKLNLIGHAPDLALLEPELVLSAFRELNEAFDHEWVSAAYSSDAGAHFSEPIRLVDCGARECGYPSILPMSENRFLLVYYAAGGRAIEGAIYRYESE